MQQDATSMEKIEDEDLSVRHIEANSRGKVQKSVLVGVIIVLILLASLLAAVIITQTSTRLIGKASGPTTGKVELANSYIFASPLKAKTGGKERIRITAFVLDSQGRGVYDKLVSVGRDNPLAVDPIQPTTDELGRAVFDVSAVVSGVYYIEAQVDGKSIPQRISITFE